MKNSICLRCHSSFSFDGETFKWKRYCPACEPLVLHDREVAKRARMRSEKQVLFSDILLEHIAVRTHREVGELLGISTQAVRLIEHKALVKVRRALQFGMTKLQVENSLRG